MKIIKILSLIFLAAYLIIGSLSSLLGFSLGTAMSFFTGLCAIASGVLILIAAKEYEHFSEK